MLREEVDRLVEERTQLIGELKKHMTALTRLNVALRTGDLRKTAYHELLHERGLLIEQKCLLEGRLAKNRELLRKHGEQIQREHRQKSALIDEYVVRAQQLLRECYTALSRKTRICGITDVERTLLDEVQQYLREQGLLPDKGIAHQ